MIEFLSRYMTVGIIRETLIAVCAGLAVPYLLAGAQGALLSALWGPELRFAEFLPGAGDYSARLELARFLLNALTGASMGFIGVWLLGRLIQRLLCRHAVAFFSSFVLMILLSLALDAGLSRVLVVLAQPGVVAFFAASWAMIRFRRISNE
jgi:hypothetical protein